MLFENGSEEFFMKIEVKELKISNELQKKIDMICRFAGVSSTLTNGCVKKYQRNKYCLCETSYLISKWK